jgi:serine/threonine protein kinase
MNLNENYKYFNWRMKIQMLYGIAKGLKEIHEKKMVHRDFHTGNILLNDSSINIYINKAFVSDLGLCGEVGNVDKTKIYGVMPYMAPEVLRGKPYTQAADIYSFGMIMYFVATERQPFDNCAHDAPLALDICNGIRPEISEPKAPKCYIELMEKCWNSNPENRPNISQLINSLSSISVNNSEIEKAEIYRYSYLSSSKENRQITTHPQAIYTSRLLNPFTKDLNSECLDCKI